MVVVAAGSLRWQVAKPACRASAAGLVNVTPSDYFELIARQTSGSTKNVAADELAWFAIEVVEWASAEPLNGLHSTSSLAPLPPKDAVLLDKVGSPS